MKERESRFLALTAEEGAFGGRDTTPASPGTHIPVHWFGGKRYKGRTLAGLALRLRRLRPDVLMPYTTRPNVLCGLIWPTTGASICVWNQRDLAPSTKFGPDLIARAAARSSLLVTNSQAGRDYLVSNLGVRPDRVRMLLDSITLPEPLSRSRGVACATCGRREHRRRDDARALPSR